MKVSGSYLFSMTLMLKPLTCIAHRGGSGPENSLEAITSSLALGVDAIEIDLWYLHGELWVTHDRRLGRQLPGEGQLLEQSRENFYALRLENGESIPKLTQVLELVGARALLNIEIKGPNCAKALAQCLVEYRGDTPECLEQILISSFDHPQLYQMFKLLPQVRRGVLVAGIPLDYARCCEELRAYSLNSDIDFVNSLLVEDAHKRGLKSWVYTANHPDDWERLSQMGVDGVFTDFPQELQQFNLAAR